VACARNGGLSWVYVERGSGTFAGVSIGALVSDAGQRQALVAIRELGQAGISSCAVGDDERAPAFASRWCDRHAIVPNIELGEAAFVDALLAVCATNQPQVLIPSHDGTIEALRRRREEFERVVGLALAAEEPLAIAVEKVRTLAIARELGLRTPRGGSVEAAGEAESVLDEVGLPAVIKPSRSWAEETAPDVEGPADKAGRRLSSSVATNRVEALAAIDAILGDGIAALVQEWLPGDREALSFLYARDRIWARFAQRADRTSPPLGGFSVARESIALPADVTPGAERLVREIGLEGYSEVEFRRDAKGAAALMEINPRLSASVEIASRAGVRFAPLIYNWVSGGPLEEVHGYRVGLRMRWLGGDIDWLRNAIALQGHPDVPSRGRATGIFLGDFLRPARYDYLDPRDPGPALRRGAEAVRDLPRRVTRRVRKAGARGLDTDVAVIGAGPYGLSLAAHLNRRGIAHEVFGEPMAGWERQMPEGMFLKSEGFASNLSDPAGEHTLEHFCAEQGIEYADIGVPVSLDTFVAYGRSFQSRLVPGLRRELISDVGRGPQGFELRLQAGSALRARRVVVATGMHGYAVMPPELRELPAGPVLHSSELREPAQWGGETVAVIGAGQSALESAALLREHGADVRVLARGGRLSWNPVPTVGPRPLRRRLRYPESGLGNDIPLWLYAKHPLVVHTASERRREAIAFTTLGPAGAWWLRPRVEGEVECLLGRSLNGAHVDGDGVHLRLNGSADEEELVATRVLAGTGYRPDVDQLAFLDRAIREQVARAGGGPVLSRGFESSVPGLYFVGFAAAIAFGPVMRFVLGADFTARRVARGLA
jgi:FAD-dependent urate hydroxylase